MNKSLYMAYSASDQNLMSQTNNNVVNGDPGGSAAVPPRSQSAYQFHATRPRFAATATVCTFSQQVISIFELTSIWKIS